MKIISNFLKFIIVISIYLLIFSSSQLNASNYSDLGIIPNGPFPTDYYFHNFWGLTVSKDVVYIAHKNDNNTWKNTLLVTFNNGKTWIPIFRGSEYWLSDFFQVDPSNSSRVYYYDYGNKKLYRTDNYGKIWKEITPSSGYLKSLAISPSNPSILYAYEDSFLRLYVSTNYGDSWIDLSASLRPINNMHIYRFYVDSHDPYKLYILGFTRAQDGSILESLYIYQLDLSNPSRDSLTKVGKGLDLSVAFTHLRQNPDKPNEIWAFRFHYGCIYKSIDGGFNFTKNQPDFCGENIFQVKVKGSNIAIATENGIRISNDGGNIFSTLIGGHISYMDTFDFRDFYYLKNSRFTSYSNGTETNSGRVTVLSLTSDRNYISGTNRTFKLNISQQYEAFISDLGLNRIEKLDNGYLVGYRDYSECYTIAQGGIYSYYSSCHDFYIPDYSRDYAYFVFAGELRKIQISTGKLVSTFTQSAGHVAVSRDEGRFAISKLNTIYVSDDGGINFHQTALSDNNGIKDILIDRENSSNIIVAGGSGLYHSSDGGQNFSQRLSGIFWNLRQLPSGIILVTSSDRAYKSFDGGLTWKPIELPYPYTIYDVTTVNNSYFFATDYGVVELPGVKNVLVFQPNGGQKWNAGSRYVIRWEAPLNSYKFILRYSTDNKATWTNIATVLASNRCTSDGTKYTCTYGWTIPAQDGRKPQSFVRVVAMDSANQVIGSDDSDRAFAIEVLRLTSPNGGETLKARNTHTITWQTYTLTKTVARVQLQYSTNNGQNWINIATVTGNPGQYNWTVPNVSSASCRVRVMLRDSAGAVIASDISDRVFTIGQ